MTANTPPLTVTLPWPHDWLFPNRRIHGKRKSGVVGQSRAAARSKTREAGGDSIRLPKQPALAVYFHPPSNRYDLDNSYAACKAYIDGMADALGVNDRIFRRALLVWGEKLETPCVILQVRDAEGLAGWLGLESRYATD